MADIYVQLLRLPAAVKGCVVPEADGSYTIYLNNLYNDEQLRDIYRHELRHLLHAHLRSPSPLPVLEAEAGAMFPLQGKALAAAQTGYLPPPPLLPKSHAPPSPARPTTPHFSLSHSVEYRRLQRGLLTNSWR